MTNWKYDTDDKSGVLSVDGDMTIAHVSELKERLVEAFSDAETVTVDVSGSNALDVAGVQLLCACHSFSKKTGKSMQLEVGDNHVFTSFLDEVGFSRNFVCNKGGEGDCLWSN
jgi:ABC-type transporter Mla MlaB component